MKPTSLVRAPSARARELPSEIRSRVNRIAHAAGQRYETELRVGLLTELQHLAAEGADVQHINAHLEALQVQGGDESLGQRAWKPPGSASAENFPPLIEFKRQPTPANPRQC